MVTRLCDTAQPSWRARRFGEARMARAKPRTRRPCLLLSVSCSCEPFFSAEQIGAPVQLAHRSARRNQTNHFICNHKLTPVKRAFQIGVITHAPSVRLARLLQEFRPDVRVL